MGRAEAGGNTTSPAQRWPSIRSARGATRAPHLTVQKVLSETRSSSILPGRRDTKTLHFTGVTATPCRAEARLRGPNSHRTMSLGAARRGQESPSWCSCSYSTDKHSWRQLTNFPSTFPGPDVGPLGSQNPSLPPSPPRAWGCLNGGLEPRGRALWAVGTAPAKAGRQACRGWVGRSQQSISLVTGGKVWQRPSWSLQ